jgi:hypothetical protein
LGIVIHSEIRVSNEGAITTAMSFSNLMLRGGKESGIADKP